jgi:glycosyltransferase involved in cell wall biosynthesis
MSAVRIVSVIVPCRNECAHVAAFAASALAQRLPDGWQLETIVADGESDDGTLDALARVAAADRRLRVLANPERIVSTGLNRALAEARGEVIVRMDVHTTYAPDYVAECLAALARTGADNVGGPWRAEAEPGGGAMQEAVVAAFQSPLVAGGALSRRLDHEGPVDTVYLGAWPRATFERFGAFDEALVRNQDDEHNLRITTGGGRVWQSARILSSYRPRARLGRVFRQYLQYGYWKPFVMRRHGQPAALRQLVPALFVLALVATAALAAGGVARSPLAVLVAAYALMVTAMTVAIARSARPRAAALVRVPLVIGASHVAYGLGSIAGWFDVVRGRRGRSRFTALTR